MAAPSATIRQAPSGIKMDDGFSTKITFARDPDIALWEKTVTPPGIDGGDMIDTTTMHNVAWRTFAPRALKTLTESTFTAAYDPAIYTQLLEVLNINDEITVTFPDGSTIAFWGVVRMSDAAENSEGSQPEMTVTVTPTNQDDDGNEQAPVVSEVAGT